MSLELVFVLIGLLTLLCNIALTVFIIMSRKRESLGTRNDFPGRIVQPRLVQPDASSQHIHKPSSQDKLTGHDDTVLL